MSNTVVPLDQKRLNSRTNSYLLVDIPECHMTCSDAGGGAKGRIWVPGMCIWPTEPIQCSSLYEQLGTSCNTGPVGL